jgi:pimeloyl-ACP methyl ester carboxylesterase
MLTILFLLLLALPGSASAQTRTMKQDSTLNNLALPPGYKTNRPGDIPQYHKAGSGEKNLILIAGLGFDGSIFDDFAAANVAEYTMYAVTLPGCGNSPAPPIPDSGTSYGSQQWTKGAVEGIYRLIQKEHLSNSIVVGHFVAGTQVAVSLALGHPEAISGVIIIGGPAKFASGNAARNAKNLAAQVSFVDKYLATKWYKTVTQQTWTENMYDPEVYSLNEETGKFFWAQSVAVPIPIMVQYLCEFFASDMSLELDKINCPVLVLEAGFAQKILSDTANQYRNYLKPQFIDTWEQNLKKNSLVELRRIPETGTFIWKDQPSFVNKAVREFISKCK